MSLAECPLPWVWQLEPQGQGPGQPGGRPVLGRTTVFGTLGPWLCPSVPVGCPQNPAWSSVLGRPFPVGVHRKGQACCCERVATRRGWPGRTGLCSCSSDSPGPQCSGRGGRAAQCHAPDGPCREGHRVGPCGGHRFYSSSLGSRLVAIQLTLTTAL